MKKVLLIVSLVFISSYEVVAHAVSDNDRTVILEEAIAQLIDSLHIWKEEVSSDEQFVFLIDQMITKLQDSSLSINSKALYAILLAKVHASEDSTEQKAMLVHMLSQSSKELMQEAAAMINLLQAEQE